MSLHWQMTYNLQGHGAFPSPYEGPNSFLSRKEIRGSFTTTLFAGHRLWHGAEGYLDLEATAGTGLSGVFGLLSPPNGETYRVSSAALKGYIARAYVKQRWSPGGHFEAVEDGENQIAGSRPSRRLVLTAGKFSVTDFFDQNRYAGDPRTQFNNWSLWANTAWDYPADTRGYTWGLVLELAWDQWAVRAGSFMEPAEANGMSLDHRISSAHGDAVELEHRQILAGREGGIRVLVYDNYARMGSYREALLRSPSAPYITATEEPGRSKWGLGLNLEQAITEHSGLFMRAGWNDGKTETWAFTEVDRTLSVGLSADGTCWGRPNDHIGIGYAVNGLSGDHRAYLAAGGLGFELGDGRLSYLPERVIDAYYSWAFFDHGALSAEVQHYTNPGANSARGPVTVYGLRLHLEF
ncbi:MAG: carbohydrate porin [Acidobacteriota bacterium]